MRRLLILSVLAVLASAATTAVAAGSADRAGRGTPVPRALSPDFDGDGQSDIAIGAPDKDFVGKADAGEVAGILLHGTVTDGIVFDEDEVGGDREKGDHFGASLAPGDFDGNGKSDLAVGTPGEDLGGIVDSGAVRIVYGSPTGLNGTGSHAPQTFTQSTSGVPDVAETGDQFGTSLIAGDFDKDGFDDLAVGTSLEDLGTATDIGTVHILYGSATGLSSAGSQQFFPGDVGLTNVAGDRFGFALAAGNFGNGGEADLAIGIPLRNLRGAADAGAAAIVYGSPDGLATDGDERVFTQNTTGILDLAETGDHFGSRFAVGDFGRTAKLDLAIGIPLEDTDSSADAGAVSVMFGTNTGLQPLNNQFLVQDAFDAGDSEPQDQFGFQLAAGNFDGLDKDDLAVTANLEDAGSLVNAGEVDTFYGSVDGLTTLGSEQILPFLVGGDQGGTSLAAARLLGNDAFADLAMASPFHNQGTGQTIIERGSASGITPTDKLTIGGGGGASERGDHAGAALSRAA